jgi:S1-C subfamily serine protease
MTLVPNDAFAKRDTNERAGAFVVNGKAGVRVVGVRSGTPAARAGLAVGDTIVRLNGERAPSLAAVRGAFLRPVGTRVTLVVVGRSGGHPRTVTFTLRDYV